MFDLYFLNKRNSWEYYTTKTNIIDIYRTIDILNLIGGTEHYRIDIDNRVFAFLNNSNYQLDYMIEHYNTNEKCKPRYTSDEYNYEKVKRR